MKGVNQMRYIDADRMANGLERAIERMNVDKSTKATVRIFIEGLQNEPAADVEEVKYAEWITDFAKLNTPKLTGEDSTVIYRCSRCGRYESRKEPYCNCGAKMDGGEKQ